MDSTKESRIKKENRKLDVLEDVINDFYPRDNNGIDFLNTSWNDKEPEHKKVDDRTLEKLLKDIEKGNERKFKEAYDFLEKSLPVEAVPRLIKIAKKVNWKDGRNQAAVLLLSKIRSDKAIEALTSNDFKSNVGREFLINSLIGIKDIRVAEYLAGIVDEVYFHLLGLTLVLSMMWEKTDRLLVEQAYSAKWIYKKDKKRPKKLLGSRIVGFALYAIENTNDLFVSAGLAFHPFLDTESVMNMHEYGQQIFATKFRIDILEILLNETHKNHFDEILNETQDNFSKNILINSIIGSHMEYINEENINFIINQTKSLEFLEKIFALFCLVRINKLHRRNEYSDLLIKELNSKDKFIRICLASMILYLKDDLLLSSSLKIINTNKKNIKIAMVPSIVYSAQNGNQECIEVVNNLSKDGSKNIQKYINQLYKEF